MTTISPSILSCDFVNIETELNHLKSAPNIWLHLDIMDGHFVPNLTFGIPIVKRISEVTKIPLDAHLMVSNPKFHIEKMKDFGIHNITFHAEACDDVLGLIMFAKKYYPSVGVSIKPGTSPKVLTEEVLEELDLVLIMSVEPGFGGQSFIESSYDKIKELNSLKEKYKFTIQIDGGVKDTNSKKLIQTGVDNLVAGSYVFKEGPSQYLNRIESLRN